jgi:hypothetical protein
MKVERTHAYLNCDSNGCSISAGSAAHDTRLFHGDPSYVHTSLTPGIRASLGIIQQHDHARAPSSRAVPGCWMLWRSFGTQAVLLAVTKGLRGMLSSGGPAYGDLPLDGRHLKSQ